MSRLLSIKTGGCPEDCGYCSQSAHHATGLKASKLMEVRARRRRSDEGAATPAPRATAWAPPGAVPRTRDMDALCRHGRGREGARHGNLHDARHARPTARPTQLKQAGLDYYNHNIDTSERYYGEVITTRTFADRLETLARVREAGIKVCCGGIVGMGETTGRSRRHAGDARQPARASGKRADQHADRRSPGRRSRTPRRSMPIDFVRTIALARIMMPKSLRAAVGRAHRDERRDAGAVLLRRRQFDLCRRYAADGRQPRRGPGRAHCSPARPRAAGASRPRRRGEPGSMPAERQP